MAILAEIIFISQNQIQNELGITHDVRMKMLIGWPQSLLGVIFVYLYVMSAIDLEQQKKEDPYEQLTSSSKDEEEE